VRRLTEPGLSHSVKLGQDCFIMATEFSSVKSLPGCQAFTINHSDSTVDGISVTSVGCVLQPSSPDNFPPPEIVCHALPSGDKLFGMVYKPHNLLPGGKDPVVLSVYGGPELQLATVFSVTLLEFARCTC